MNLVLLTVASNLAVASCIAVIAYGVGRWGRSPALAHLLWMAVFIKLITPPLVVANVTVPSGWAVPFQSVVLDVQPSQQSQPGATNTGLRPEEAPVFQPDLAGSNFVFDVLHEVTLTRCLIAVWLLGSFLILLRGVLRFAQFSRLLVRESVIDEEATAVVNRLVAGGRTLAPAVRRVGARVSPMLFGVGNATCIVCPNRLWDQLSETQREAFLAHEVAHFMRRDHWVRWLEWFVTAIYWWFPLVYWARQQLERHEEAACDAWAVSQLKAPRRVYAETLLNVVDFLSENRVGVPRLASRMQGTVSLEERLRLIMSSDKQSKSTRFSSGVIVTVGLALLVLHPLPKAVSAVTMVRSAAFAEAVNIVEPPDKLDFESPPSSRSLPLVSLPPVPRGWWNEAPTNRWADVGIGGNDLKLLAEAGVGISVVQNNQSQHIFDSQTVRAIAHVASSGRLIIGHANGEIHLWDVNASQAVSLIGKHPNCVTSIAFHPKSGLVSGDASGNILAWDIQSGQIKGSVSVGGPVSSVRWSKGGETLATVVNDWASSRSSAELYVLDGSSLKTMQTVHLPHNVAIAQQHAREGWLAIDWTGTLWSLINGRAVGVLPKEHVSGVVLCQDIFDRIEYLPARPLLETTYE